MSAFLMRLAGGITPALNFQVPLQRLVAWLLVLFGVMIAGLGVAEFRRAKTTVNPIKPGVASSLVTSGVYRRTRNPMYMGFLFMLAGVAMATANLLALLLLPSFVLYMNKFQIRPEERALGSIFGADYERYCARTKRWI